MIGTILKEYEHLPFDKSYGIIAVLRHERKEDRFLILRQVKGHWSFPKGHGERNETPLESALRELSEETGITDIQILDLPTISDTYVYEKDVQKVKKLNEYFIGIIKNDYVTTQEEEISEYIFATEAEAIATFTY